LVLSPDFVLMDIMDIMVPDDVPDGINCKESLNRFLFIDHEAKMAMCSSLGQQILITESMKIGSIGFIVKPFGHDGMLDVIRKIGEPN